MPIAASTSRCVPGAWFPSSSHKVLCPGLVSRNDRYLSRRKRDRRRLIAGFWCRCRPRNEPASPNEHALDRDRDPLAFHRAARFSSSSLPLLRLQPRRRYRFLSTGAGRPCNFECHAIQLHGSKLYMLSTTLPPGSGWFTGSSIPSSSVNWDRCEMNSPR